MKFLLALVLLISVSGNTSAQDEQEHYVEEPSVDEVPAAPPEVPLPMEEDPAAQPAEVEAWEESAEPS